MSEEHLQLHPITISTRTNLQVKTANYDIKIAEDPTITDLKLWLSGSKPKGKLTVNSDGTTIVVEIDLPLTGLFQMPLLHSCCLEVRLPSYISINSLLVSSSSGDINFASPVACSFIGAKTISGDIESSLLQALDGELVLESTSGDINAKHLIAPKATISSVSGDIDINEIEAQTVAMENTSGDIDACVRIEGGTLVARSISGDIDIMLIGSPDVTIETKTISGDISIPEAAILGNSTGSVRVNTTSGDIEITLG